jgi:hypothetical protein
MVIGANVFRRWEQHLDVTSTAHFNAGHPWIVQTSANADIITAIVEWEPRWYHMITGSVPSEGPWSTSRWSVASVPLFVEGSSVFRDNCPLGTQSYEWPWHEQTADELASQNILWRDEASLFSLHLRHGDNRQGHSYGAPSATWRCTSSRKAEVLFLAQASLVVGSCGGNTSGSCNSGRWQHVRVYWRGHHARHCLEHLL